MSADPVEFIRTQTTLATPSIIPEMHLYLASEVTPLWQLTEARLREENLPPPYWAFAWPGGQGVARYLLDHPEIVRSKRVVDFAAGSGMAAIAAMLAGAKQAVAVDIDPLALTAIALNAEHNKVAVDILNGADLSRAYGKADVIVAGDICYQQATSTAVTRWLRLCVEAGVRVIMGDPGRAYVPHEGLCELACYDVPTSRDLEDSAMRRVTVWQLEKIVH